MLDSILDLTAWGQALASWLVPTTVWTAALLAGALLLDRALARRARASWRIALYAPIALRLLLPLSWRIPVAHAPRVVTLLTPVPEALLPPHLAPVAAPLLTWQAALALAYVAVALALAFVRVRARLRLQRELAGARPVDAGRLATTAPCPIVEHEELGPMVVGTLRPRIVLPSAILAPGQAGTLACVLGHESAHVRRRDPWLMAAMQVMTVGFWPVLPVWLAAQRVRALVEMACDEAALGDADATARSRYGHTLLDLAEWRSVTLAPLGAGELHFGSMLRARIEALASMRRWPRAVQGALVALAVAGFAACSSVGSGPTEPSTSPRVEAATPSVVEADLRRRCPHFMQRFAGWSDPVHEWLNGPVDAIPADEVTTCRSAEVRAQVEDSMWSTEARNVIGQMAKDLAAAYERDWPRGNYSLCPSDGPVPRTPQGPGQPYRSTHADWNDGPGFRCMQFEIDSDHPIYFQYRLDTDARGFLISAHARRAKREHTVDLTMTLRGEIQADHVLSVAPSIEETWKVLP